MLNCYCQEKCVHSRWRRVCLIKLVLIATVCGATVGACTSPARHAQLIARAASLEPLELTGTRFHHHAFVATREPHGLLVLFIDGDGSPWVGGGRRIAEDPTPRRPLALQLAALTPASVLYLGRPCYMEPSRPPECTERLWTAERYSAEVVASLSAAASSYINQHHFERVLLVGYSGGGTLAALMATSLPNLKGFVSIAGNLDPDTWTRLHGYLPLQGSLNPALQPPLPADLPQWYLVGERDLNVSGAASARYLGRVPRDRIWSFPRFDHRCCWVGEWASIFSRISAELR